MGADPNKEPVEALGADPNKPLVAGFAAAPNPPKPPVVLVEPKAVEVVGVVVLPKPVPRGLEPPKTDEAFEGANGFVADGALVLPNNPPVAVVDMDPKPVEDGAPKAPVVDVVEVPNPPKDETCGC